MADSGSGSREPDYAAGGIADWQRVDAYLGGLFARHDHALNAALANNAAAGLPAHDVSPLQGKLLALLIAASGSRRILEIGTLGGYSTIWMARALPQDGELVSLEVDPTAVRIAQANLAQASLTVQVSLLHGAALDLLPNLQPSFDLIFIDADKPNNPAYLDQAVRLSRPGTLIVGDNIVRGGAVTDPSSSDDRVTGVRRFLRMIADHPRLDATAIQTAGEKGWDGFVLARVL